MKPLQGNSTMHAAAFGAAVLIAGQVAGKATRDAFFLSQFPVTSLPVIVVASSLLSIAAGLATARFITTFAPDKVLPRAFMASSALLLIEWVISVWSPALAAVLIYLQVTILGSVLISGFWTLLDDRFDARSARRQFGGIVGASTVGGIVGGLLAGRVGFSMGVGTMLPVLAFLHIVAGFLAANLTARKPAAKRPTIRQKHQARSGLFLLRTVPYVRNLALLVVLSTMGAGLLDYVFKARVAMAFPDDHDLVGFFALFYTATGVATFLLQLILSRATVERFGIAGSVGSLPFALTFGSLGALVLPGLPAAFAMRGGEAMVRSSLFKSGYEMLYAAMPRRERQATKSILDIGVDRLGDLLGALLLAIIAWAGASGSMNIMLIAAAVLGLAGLWISQRLRRGYVNALENSLLSQSMSAPQISKLPALGASILLTLRNLTASPTPQPRPLNLPAPPARTPDSGAQRDPLARRLQDLRSSNAETVRNALKDPLDVTLVPSAISLLAWDEVAAEAIAALRKMGPRITGQLVDALVDPDQEFAVRRRIPRVLGDFNSQRAFDGLMDGLSDTRFEVRFHVAESLARMKRRSPHLAINEQVVTRTVERELEVNPEVWRSYRVIDSAREVTDGTITVDHIFRLLALVHAPEPLQIAHRALTAEDDHLKQTSLEYLENVLPDHVWQRIVPLFEEGTTLASVG